LKNSFPPGFKPLSQKRYLINAGPTREPIDPVRFISNYSSGKMGIALADVAAFLGAEVHLVLGPVSIMPSNQDIRIYNVTTASEMASECIRLFPECDVAILSAAVADFTPESPLSVKIKKTSEPFFLKLVPTIDISFELGQLKKPYQIIAGFALETDNELENAIEKLKKKNLDIIVLNSLKDKGAAFGSDTNKITIIDKNNNINKFELKSKNEAAKDIIYKIISISTEPR